MSRTWSLLLAGALLLTGCGAPAASTGPATASAASSSAPTRSTQLRVITHDSFALSKEVVAAFEAKTGYEVVFNAPGDAGTVVNQLVLTKSAPIADVVFGIDNTFAGRAFAEGVLSPYSSAALPDGAAQYAADDSHRLTPIDYGDVCLNADTEWFLGKGLAVPATLDDLLKPEYRDLLVVANPATSSPGLSFLLATIAAKGEAGYLDYWAALRDNGLKVVKGWTEAYTVEFSGSSGKGKRPLVLSYASSPAFEPATESLNQTCFRQIEYAGVVAGSANQVGAGEFIDFLLSAEVQAEIPDQMYMYPVHASVKLPTAWAEHAALPEKPFTLPAAQIAAGRDGWIKAWTAAVIG